MELSDNILRDKYLSNNLNRMTNLILSLSNVMSAVYSGFNEGWKLVQIQHVHVTDVDE